MLTFREENLFIYLVQQFIISPDLFSLAKSSM